MSLTSCCCNCRTTTYTFLACGFGVAGSVTFTMGMTTLSGTTDAFGHVTFTFPSDGSWDYVFTPTATYGYSGPLTGTVSVLCSSVHNAQTISLSCDFPKVLTYSGSITQSESSFYFNQVYGCSYGGPAEPATYTLTYGPLPSAIPTRLTLLYFTGPNVCITMPANAWFSDPIPVYSNESGRCVDCYFYGWRSGCSLNVMVIDVPYETLTAAGAGDKVHGYGMSSCVPFKLKHNLVLPADVTGTHGSDDITGISAGVYSGATAGACP